MQQSQDAMIAGLAPQKQPKITKEVLHMVDQLHAKLNRLNSDVQIQERISRNLDTQFQQLKNQYRQTQSDLRHAQEQLAQQKHNHQQAVISAQAQAKQTDSFNQEYQLRKKERAEVMQLIEKQREQLSIAQASAAKYKLIIDSYQSRIDEQDKMKQGLISQNDKITNSINRAGKNCRQMSITNQKLIDDLEELKQQMLD